MAARAASPMLRLAQSAWVRSGPSAAAEPLGVAKRGSALARVGQTPRGDWLAVAWRGGLGWVNGRFFTK